MCDLGHVSKAGTIMCNQGKQTIVDKINIYIQSETILFGLFASINDFQISLACLE